MSEKILETLMHLFAIIAEPDSKADVREELVMVFLRRLTNQEQAEKYITIYRDHYEKINERVKKRTIQHIEGSIAIRITRLCNEINKQRQLDQEQRIVVVIQALEFCKWGKDSISTTEADFITTLAEGLSIDQKEYEDIRKFVENRISSLPSSSNILIINNIRDFDAAPAKHICRDTLRGQIWILYLPSVNMYFVRQGENRELLINGQILGEGKIYPFSEGSSIKGSTIKPIYYWEVTMQFLKQEFRESRVVYEVSNLEYNFKSGDTGIHKMSFREESGRLVGIMGASGAGKSTLLSILNGTYSPTSGEVRINGIDIHSEKEKIKGLIGYVSQDDLLIEELTVFENLYFNAKLCFGNLGEKEIAGKVDEVLKSLGLYDIRNMKVGSPLNKKISGGQRKRLNISLELIREPAIMFLDEPTSGLSSRDSENILDLLKEMTRKGKLLFVVIHQPSSDIFKMFDKLILLDTGGYLIYYGNPVESIGYFKRMMDQINYSESECPACGNVNPEQIFNIVETKVFTESGKSTEVRRISPSHWSRLYEKEHTDDPLESATLLPESNFRTPGLFKQYFVFTRRDILSKITDLQYLLITLLEAPVLAMVLASLIRYFDKSAENPHYSLYDNANLPVYIFMSVIIAFFMGLTVSSEEIIKDRKILKREEFLNLSRSSYLLSKVTVQFGISAIQAFLYVLIGNSITGIHEMYFEYWLVLFSCWAGANVLGLVISDSFKAVVTIYILIPFLVIPQIILSGVIVKYEKLNPDITSPVAIPVYGEFITARWGYEALAVNQFINNRYEKKLYVYDKARSKSNYMKYYWYTEIKDKLEDVISTLEAGQEVSAADLLLISNEISKVSRDLPSLSFSYQDRLTPSLINIKVAGAGLEYIESVKRHYINYYNRANDIKDSLIAVMQKSDPVKFVSLQAGYFNKSLEDFVTAKNENQKIISYRDHLVQKVDPIYRDPEYRFIRAHFYSPVKNFMGREFSTFSVNIVILWAFTMIYYLILHFRLLKKALDSGGELFGSRKARIKS